jgi:parallel beta-helix repeat protein
MWLEHWLPICNLWDWWDNMTKAAFGTINTQTLIDPDATQEFDAVVAPSGADYTTVGAAVTAGAKTILVKQGTYDESAADITLTNGVRIIGDGPYGSVILDFGGTANQIVIDGGGGTQETAGTLTATNGSAAILGDVSAMFTNLSPLDYLIIKSVAYLILSIADNQNLTLTTAFQGATEAGLAVLGQTMVTGVTLQNLVIQNSTSEGLFARQALVLTMDLVVITACGTAATTPNITITQSVGVSLNNCAASAGPFNGMQFTGNFTGFISGCVSTQNNGIGFQIDGCNDIRFGGCQSLQNDGDGVNILGASNNIIWTAAALLGNNGKGLDVVAGASNVIITDSHIEDNASDGVDYDGSANVVANCHIANNGGIGVQGGDNGTITGNQITGNTSFGVSLTADTFSSVIGNRINNNGDHGVNIPAGGDTNLITGNIVTNNAGDGINVAGNDNVITGNEIVSNTGDGIEFTAASSGNRLVNNTISGNGGTAFVDAGTDNIDYNDSIHPDIAAQITAITAKATLAGADVILIEDSAAGNIKKSVLASNITTGAVIANSNLANVSAASRLIGRGSAAGAGAREEIILGTNLSMSGTTLNATGGSGSGYPEALGYTGW